MVIIPCQEGVSEGFMIRYVSPLKEVMEMFEGDDQ